MEFLGEFVIGLFADDGSQFLAQGILNRTVKFQRFRNGHLVNFASDDAQSGAAQHINDVAGFDARASPVVGLDDDQGAFAVRFLMSRIRHDVFACFRKISKHSEALLTGVIQRRRENGGLEVVERAVAVENEVCISVADGFADDIGFAVLGVRELPDDSGKFGTGIFALEEEHKDAFA